MGLSLPEYSSVLGVFYMKDRSIRTGQDWNKMFLSP